MPEFDFGASLRWARKFEGKSLKRRPASELPFFDPSHRESVLLLDTSVYIDRLQAKISDDLRTFLDTSGHHHSVISLQEMMLAVGVLDPADPRTSRVTRSIGELIGAINSHRLHGVDVEVSARAALLAGILSRVQGYGRDGRTRALNDCTLFLQSQQLGTTLLTRNYADFDILLQMIPAGRVLFY